ncbi:MAG: FAD-dependent oxidoreductase [Cyanobacteria bacterium]|nr:FAD-dependent oxidoreductase [Cyanobacteria bacterium CG_2015-16_32_12]NCO78179.1 FAD-dependent oxidoreductase [Cyanobacteria bacterium CG_2015-22_32_23]NCQ40320.1 FAD-dependent oxidoreductase [Cyanobacteria bacterium CG_2015-04_32_10]NCS84882.1 FAD-dependent oxidoreductase [Cyanobacteria bacterium CG_2015-02_32_10]
MKLKYDLVVIGLTKQAIFAAEYAVKLGARVALIFDDNNSLEDNFSYLKEEYKSDLLNLNGNINRQQFLKEKDNLFTNKYLPNLTLLGVDLIKDKCQFSQQKKLVLLTNNHELESSSYLLAMTLQQLFPEELLTNKENYLTMDNLISQEIDIDLPDNIIIISNDINGIYLANKLNKNITLVTENKQLLPSEDENISFQLQLILEGKGIKIYTQSNFKNFDFNNRQKWGDSVIITNKKLDLNVDKIGLKSLGININKGKISVNKKLQTFHPQIYSCGDLLGGYNLDNITEYEVKVAVNNALFFPWQDINYSKIPYSLMNNPSIYRLGYTEKQAKLLIGNNIRILLINFTLESSLSLTQNDLFIKIIIDKNNYILGFHSIGYVLEEILIAITLLKRQEKPFNYLFDVKFSQPSSLQIIKYIQQVWLEKNKRQHQFIMDLTETFFIWKK